MTGEILLSTILPRFNPTLKKISILSYFSTWQSKTIVGLKDPDYLLLTLNADFNNSFSQDATFRIWTEDACLTYIYNTSVQIQK